VTDDPPHKVFPGVVRAERRAGQLDGLFQQERVDPFLESRLGNANTIGDTDCFCAHYRSRYTAKPFPEAKRSDISCSYFALSGEGYSLSMCE
jgi:hypothetical protein